MTAIYCFEPLLKPTQKFSTFAIFSTKAKTPWRFGGSHFKVGLGLKGLNSISKFEFVSDFVTERFSNPLRFRLQPLFTMSIQQQSIQPFTQEKYDGLTFLFGTNAVRTDSLTLIQPASLQESANHGPRGPKTAGFPPSLYLGVRCEASQANQQC